jgi:hypothetical protein
MANAISMVECSRGPPRPDLVQPATMKCCAQDPIRHTCCFGLALTADSYTSSHYHNLFRSIGVVINHPVEFQAFYSVPIAPSGERVTEAAQ